MSIATALAASVMVAVIWFNTEPKGLLRDGSYAIALAENGTLSGLDQYPVAWRGSIGEMIRSRTVQVPESVADLQTATRGNSDESAYVRPVGIVIRSATPEFQWRSYGEGCSYRVLVYELGKTTEAVKSDVLSSTSWSVPEHDALERGLVYEWEIMVIVGDIKAVPEERRPRFEVMSDEMLRRVTEAEEAAKGSHLVLAAAYLEAGLVGNAQRELEALAAANPDVSIVNDLLRSLKEQR